MGRFSKLFAVLGVVLVGSGAALAQKPPANDTELASVIDKASAGDRESQTALGFYYELRQDFAQAAAWFRRAADQGHPKAQNQLGLAYALGAGVAQDYVEAVAWYLKAAAQNDVKAQNNLGVMYDTGLGVPQDYAEAVSWYRKAADQGDAFAENNLGVMYDTGKGVTQDFEQAVVWYRKSADQGDAYAQNNLGLMYARGQGVPQDYTTAYVWYEIADARGPYDVQKLATANRDEAAGKLTPEQIAEAKKRARDWLADFDRRRGK